MDGARLSRFPHVSWLAVPVTGTAAGDPLVVDMRGVCHAISITLTGNHTVRWIHRGRETRWDQRPRTLHVMPADGEQHTFITNPPPDFTMAAVLIPEGHIPLVAESEGVRPPAEMRRLVLADDAVLAACVTALGSSPRGDAAHVDCRNDEVARRLVLRLCELNGMRPPDWHDDASVFDRRTLNYLVAHIDEHLRSAPSAADLSQFVGMSPSHFARKFRQSTGLSLHRFVNRRRVRRALELLKTDPDSLAGIACDLGFASQSHFTRLFSGLTGVTPARYRSQFRRTVG